MNRDDLELDASDAIAIARDQPETNRAPRLHQLRVRGHDQLGQKRVLLPIIDRPDLEKLNTPEGRMEPRPNRIGCALFACGWNFALGIRVGGELQTSNGLSTRRAASPAPTLLS